MAPKIAIVTDSTADLNSELVQKHNITVVPLNVHFQDEVYKDGIDIDPDTFFDKLEQAAVPPRTSQPSPGDFHKVYKALLAGGAEAIISIHISRELSGTWQSATIARDMLPEADIRIVNTKSASMGIGMIVINTAEKLAQGATSAEAHEYAESLVEKQHVVFAVDTLEYLHRNGRIGRAAKLVGGLLNVKPMLHLDADGFVAPLGKVRGSAKVVPFLLAQAEQFVEGYTGPVDIGIVHGQKPELAEEIGAELKRRISAQNIYISSIGSVIGTHTGPGVIGVVIQKR